MKKSHEYRDKSDVLRAVNDSKNNIKFVRLVFPDILGRFLHFSIPVQELSDAFDYGKIFNGSSLNGFINNDESELKIKPDPKTFRVLPWEYKSKFDDLTWKEAILFSDVYTVNDELYSACPRYILKKLLQKAKESFNVDEFRASAEIEFYLFSDSQNNKPIDNGSYYFSGKYGEIRKEVQIILFSMGVFSEMDYHESSNSQHGIVLKYTDAVSLADRIMLFKYVTKKVASAHGLYASFMPKVSNDLNGSGMHFHVSVWSKNKGLLYNNKDKYHLSPFGKQFLAGILNYSSDTMLLTNQWINSFQRINENHLAPLYKIWSRKNRESLVRMPLIPKGREKTCRFEIRTPDSACNPYLALSAIISTGLQGVKENLELSEPIESVNSLSDEVKHELKKLPDSLEHGIELAKKSKLIKLTLGQNFYDKLIANKEFELAEFRKDVKSFSTTKKVSDYELKKYFSWL